MSDLRRGLVKDQLSAARHARAQVEGRPSLKPLGKDDRNRCLYAMDLIEQSFNRLFAIDELQGLAWIALHCEFLSTTEDNLRKRRDKTTDVSLRAELKAERTQVLGTLVRWQKEWEALGIERKREDEVLTLIAHASDSKLLVERLLKRKKRQLKDFELADPAGFSHDDSEDGEEPTTEEVRRREWESEVEAAKKEVETVEAVLNYVTASLILPAGETCETRYHDAPPPPPSAPARRATHPHPVRAGHARRPTLVQASLEDGKKMGSGEGEGWWGLLNFFKRRNTEPALLSAGEGEERELGRRGKREGTYRMRRRYLGEGY
ncbi:RHTO0S18e02850g1_1 [Rhodotorula toruloides]|uniref:RHTO0S18e02850g1_1 n=1 Tax=Rhodotorula toruloides TaxID=5286 RepID=A0A061BND4_RHOTO|nr:RHTO0S18e02850g1_1 [Rhodotorula toruloides]